MHILEFIYQYKPWQIGNPLYRVEHDADRLQLLQPDTGSQLHESWQWHCWWQPKPKNPGWHGSYLYHCAVRLCSSSLYVPEIKRIFPTYSIIGNSGVLSPLSLTKQHMRFTSSCSMVTASPLQTLRFIPDIIVELASTSIFAKETNFSPDLVFTRL